MVSLEIRESELKPSVVAFCSLGALLCMIVAVIGIKLRWFRHRLTFDGLPTAPKRDSGENSTVVVTGFYRKATEFDNFVAIERPQSLPPIRLDKRSRARNSHIEATSIRHTILNIEADTKESSTAKKEAKELLKQQNTQPENLENVTKSRKKAPQPPKAEPSINVVEDENRPESNGTIKEPQPSPDNISSSPIPPPPPPPTQKKRSLFSLKGQETPETKPKATKVRVLKPKHQKNKGDRLSILSKTSSPRDDDREVKILAESEVFAPVPIPRKPARAEENKEPRTLQFADNDEIIGQSENYDSWDLVSKHRQSLNHLTTPPKPKPRDSVAYHRQKVTGHTFILGVDNDDDDDDETRPRTLREMQKERQKLSLTKDISDTEA